MKKTLTILLLVTFGLYQFGYIGIYFHLIQQNNKKWLSTIEFSDDLRKIEIPISLPYWQDQEDFQPTDGALTIDGKAYRKVYQKYANDTVTILLIRDFNIDKINRLVRQFVDNQATGDQTTPADQGLLALLKQDFHHGGINDFSFNQTAFLQIHAFGYLTSHSNAYLSILTPPPLA